MSSLLLPRHFYNQPQGAVQIDWSNPLTQGLIHVFDGANYYDAMGSGRRIVPAGTGAIGPTEQGLALIGNNTSASGSLAIDLSPYRGFSYSGWVEVQPQAAVGADDMLFEYTNNFNNTAGAFALDMKSASGFVDLLVRPTLSLYGTTRWATPTAGWHYITSSINQDDSTFSTQRKLYVDGILQTPHSHSATGALTAGFPNSTLYLMSRGNASLYYAGKMAGFALHGRAISDSEAGELAANPWQIFRVSE